MNDYDDEYDDEFENDRDDNDRASFRQNKRDAEERIYTPAQALLVLSILSIVLLVLGLVLEVVLYTMLIPNGDPRLNKDRMMLQSIVRTVWSIIMIGSNILTLLGSIKMKSMTSRSWSYIACISALIVPFGPCCILGAPFGIWGLVVMNDRKVSKYFDS